ncbi:MULTISPECIES: hypothetical protein [Roseinatronobacter]|uniref:Uncharacterized protein n=1 Tax=Roseinatronobacter domitianus TaxID=2940293 RepID=A0ABT0M025_9RHOB|nr:MULTISPECIES: hypothetical protein [Roseibaca]MCL1628209.1 hypothetical protein [Roseibaca domitiana]
MEQTGFDFMFLKQQIDEGILVEDPETLADLALLVPDLVDALEGVQGTNEQVDLVLKTARNVIMRNCGT